MNYNRESEGELCSVCWTCRKHLWGSGFHALTVFQLAAERRWKEAEWAKKILNQAEQEENPESSSIYFPHQWFFHVIMQHVYETPVMNSKFVHLVLQVNVMGLFEAQRGKWENFSFGFFSLIKKNYNWICFGNGFKKAFGIGGGVRCIDRKVIN